jgi:hypothetical protein
MQRRKTRADRKDRCDLKCCNSFKSRDNDINDDDDDDDDYDCNNNSNNNNNSIFSPIIHTLPVPVAARLKDRWNTGIMSSNPA